MKTWATNEGERADHKKANNNGHNNIDTDLVVTAYMMRIAFAMIIHIAAMVLTLLATSVISITTILTAMPYAAMTANAAMPGQKTRNSSKEPGLR